MVRLSVYWLTIIASKSQLAAVAVRTLVAVAWAAFSVWTIWVAAISTFAWALVFFHFRSFFCLADYFSRNLLRATAAAIACAVAIAARAVAWAALAFRSFRVTAFRAFA